MPVIIAFSAFLLPLPANCFCFFFFRCNVDIKLILQYPTFCVSSAAGIPHAVTKISIIAPDGMSRRL